MLNETSADPARAALAWVEALQEALHNMSDGSDAARLRPLFLQDCHWRDLLAMTWRLQTLSGADAVIPALAASASNGNLRTISLATDHQPPTALHRGGRACIEAFLTLTTKAGQATGVVRLCPDLQDQDRLKAWTLMTALKEIHGHPEKTGDERPKGQSYSRDFRGPNWADLRTEALAYNDRDPAVLVVGGGQAGLAIAARLSHLGVDTLIVDREARIGDNWRLRYHALTLHNQVQVNHMPYIPFPASWPTYIPKDKLANWFETYVEALELNFWTGTDFLGGSYDEAAGHWQVTLRRADGTERIMHPRHVVMATGVSGIPNVPDIPMLQAFNGPVIHSSHYTDGDDWTGKAAIVVGTGNSGHDIAQDLASAGGTVTMVQRSPSMVVNIEPSAQLPYQLYDSGPSLEDCDLIAQATPISLVRQMHQDFTRQSCALDRELLDGLSARGFRHNLGTDNTGWQFMYLTRGGGYYFNVGASDMIVDGTIGLIQYTEIERFTPTGARLSDGRDIPADLVVLATGYRPQEELVARLFGQPTADRVGKIWGFETPDAQELSNMFCRTPQPGLWFIAGSLAQCRIFSKFLGLQIKAVEEGLIS